MTGERLEISSPLSKFCRCSHIVVGLVFTVILFVVLLEVITLSKDVDESRRLSRGLSSDLLQIKEENKNLRKQLGDMKETLEGILREKWISVQKGSPVRKRRNDEVRRKSEHQGCRKKEKKCCHKFIREQLSNCTNVRKCIPPQDQDSIHVHGIPDEVISSWRNAPETSKNLSWGDDDKQVTKNIDFLGDNEIIYISQKGVYYIYCNLRVKLKYIEVVSIKMGNKILFSTNFKSFQASNATFNHYHDVNLNGLAYLSEGDKLYVQVKPRYTKDITTDEELDIADLFPYARNTPEKQKNDNFGLFMVSKHDVS
ncbi:uncharacterized protein LOC141892430 [Acropora palmata]|uniref:uncharacterized protein LOC141892430 n=1 Tax=Acropora palmata TaxID=6131 RepID=UPI003DA08206